MASYSIDDMPIDAFYLPKLKAAGIRSTTTLLRRARTPKLRKELAKATGIPMKLILDWANIADLTRVAGIAIDYAQLLVAAGVNTAKDLARRNPDTLVAKLAAANVKARKPIVQLLPQEKRLGNWIASARKIPAGMEY